MLETAEMEHFHHVGFGLLVQPFFSSYLHHKDRNKVSNILCMDKWGKGLIGTNQNDST